MIAFFCLCAVCVADEQTTPTTQQFSHRSQSNDQLISYWEYQIKTIDPNSNESNKFVPVLMKLLKDEQTPSGLRERIALTLGRMGQHAKDAVPLVVQLLTDSQKKDEQLWLLKSLSLYGQHAKPATTLAISIVKSNKEAVTVRRAAMELLSRIGTADQRSVLALTQAMTIQSTSKNHLSDADSALMRETAAEGIAYLGIHGKSAIPALNRLLLDEDEGVRRKAVVALGAIGFASEITFPSLLDLMANDESSAVQDEVVYTFAKIGPDILPSIQLLLTEEEITFRRRIVKSICEMRSKAKPALKELKLLLQDDDATIQINAAETVWLITRQGNSVIPTLLELIKNKHRQIRIRTAKLFIQLGASADPAIPSLKKMQHHPRSDVRQAATYVLRKLKQIKK